MPEIENQIIEKSKRTISRSVAEGESATNADIIEEDSFDEKNTNKNTNK